MERDEGKPKGPRSSSLEKKKVTAMRFRGLNDPRILLRKSFIVLFLLFLCTPGVMFAVGEPAFLKADLIRQNRAPEKFPPLLNQPLAKWPHALEKYLTDNLGLRKWFIASQMRFFEWYLHTPVTYALRGEQYGLYALRLIRRHITPFPHEKERLFQLRALWTARQEYLKLHGITYLLVIPPDKESVLGRDIAWWFPVLNERHNFAYKVQRMLSRSGINFMVFDSLFAAEEEPQSLFYQKRDLFHWSRKGFMLANAAVERKLAALLPGKSFENTPSAKERIAEVRTPPYGSEAVASYYYSLTPESFTTERCRFVEAGFPLLQVHADGMKITNHLPNASGAMVIARDSFYGAFAFSTNNRFIGPFPPWACNFATIYTIDRAEFTLRTLEKIAALKPLVVIDAHCERTLGDGDSREAHIPTMLLGEKFLGNLKFVLSPNTPVESLKLHGQISMKYVYANAITSSIAIQTGGGGG
ncbi:hypothetical protein [Desulfovibrio sp. ZJ209]|nr:hypothetical protein [Desulfovibrio sp. ZJ209]